MSKGKIVRSLLLSALSFSIFLTGCISADSLLEGKLGEETTNRKYFILTEGQNSNNNTGSNNNGSGNSGGNNSSNKDEQSGPVSTGEWKQERFYIGSCLCPTDEANLQIMKDAGYNLIEMSTMNSQSSNESAAAICDKLGLYYIMSNTETITLHKVNNFNETGVQNAVYKYKDYKNMIGYNVWDEPLLEENGSDNVAKAKRMIEYLNKYDPNSLKFINLLPSYGVFNWDSTDYNWESSTYGQYAEAFIKDANPSVVSVDYYPYCQGHQGDTSNWWRDLGLFRQLGKKYNKPYWYYYQQEAIYWPDTGAIAGSYPTDNEVKYQMYTALAYGVKSLIAWNANVYDNGAKTEYFNATKARNQEIMAVGNYLFDKTSVNLYHTGEAASHTDKFYIDKLAASDLIKSSNLPRVIMGVFEDGKTDTKYLLVVNKDTAAKQTGTISLKSSKNISKFNTSTEKEDALGSSSSISIDIPAGGGALYILN